MNQQISFSKKINYAAMATTAVIAAIAPDIASITYTANGVLSPAPTCAAATENKSSAKRENDSYINSLETIIESEDSRTLKKEVLELTKSSKQDLRRRAYLAIGSIGDNSGLSVLISALGSEKEPSLRQVIVFAIGEMEEKKAVTDLLKLLASTKEALEIRARAAEALGKISTAKSTLTATEKNTIFEALSKVLSGFEHSKTLTEKEQFLICRSLTALLRLKAPNSKATMELVSKQLKAPNAEIRWQAANVMSRLKEGIANHSQEFIPLLNDPDPLVRAYSTKALGLAKDRTVLDTIVSLLKDKDEKVSSAAVSALGSIGDPKAVPALLDFGHPLLDQYKKVDPKTGKIPEQQNSLLLLASALGTIKDAKALSFLHELRSSTKAFALCPEVEIAIAQFGDDAFFAKDIGDTNDLHNWQSTAARAQGLAELKSKRAEKELLSMLDNHPDPRAESEILNAIAALKYSDLVKVLLEQLGNKDVIVRATAASLLGEHGESESKERKDEIRTALWNAYLAARDEQMNDARIAFIEAATKIKHPFNNEVLAGKYRDSDYIVRRRALELQHEFDPNDASLNHVQIGPVNTNHDRNYWRRMAQIVASTENLTAIVLTPKGKIVIELFLHDSPLTVDNFVTLSRRGYYDGLTFMRVVPNFVIQGGDPRNDMNGGPGYQIRCEINEHPYRTGSLGMALSGKDTGGSQFFITHSPQPHLDGGYTSFGKVRSGMEVVNSIARGDKINHIEIVVTK